MRTLILWMAAISVLLTLTACGGGDSGNGDGTGNLSNGGTIFGVDGVAIHALNGTLDSPIDAFITTATQPIEPQLSGTQVVGNYYRLSASQDIHTKNTSPFVLSFPVPAGVDTMHLALAARVPSEGILDADRTGNEWTMLTGQYDATENTFLTTLPFLSADGWVFVLVTHPDFTSPTRNTVTGQALAKGVTGSSSNSAVEMIAHDFYVYCLSLICSNADRQAVAQQLALARAELMSMGFPEPALRIEYEDIGLSSGEPIGIGYAVFIWPNDMDTCKDDQGGVINGTYHPNTVGLFICASPSSPFVMTQDVADTIVHEYFHATQFAYDNVLASYNNGVAYEQWLIEGTATMAENSYIAEQGPGINKVFRDTTRAARFADVSLRSTEGSYEYQAQDFWVYAGRKHHQDMNSLIPILQAGAGIEDIDANLYGSNLKDMYWSWVKNTIMEHTIDLFDVTPPDTLCTYRWLTTSGGYAFNVDLWAIYLGNTYTVTLEPLSSILVHLKSVITDYPRPATPMLVDADPAIRFKTYIDGEPGCENIPDGLRDLDTSLSTIGTTTPHYMIISNTDFENAQTFKISAKFGP